MRTILLAVLFFVVVLLASWTSHAGVDAERGRTIYSAVCLGCHGANGEGDPLWNAPRLMGQHDTYLERQLRYFRDGIRGAEPDDKYGWVMAGMVRSLPDEQALKDVVAYISTLDAPPAPRTETSGDPKRGRDRYTFICARCHGTKGQGVRYPPENDVNNPRLVGQHDWYLLRQLQKFKSKLRGAHDEDRYGLQMRVGIIELQEEQEMRDIVAYIQTLDVDSNRPKDWWRLLGGTPW